MIIKLFENLSYRLRNENDLSDITWAFCETSLVFKKDFINFFFPDLYVKNIINFEREKTKENSRADFYIEDDENNIYIIEAKINDNNHHFEQYCETYKIEKHNLGYILNYGYFKENFETKSWTKLYDYFSLRIKHLEEIEDKKLYESYLIYLKNVCYIIPIKNKITLKKMHDLFIFSEILKRQLNFKNDNFSVEIYSRKLNDIRSGYDIKISSFGKFDDIYMWIGVYYNVENPIICFEIWNKEGWGKPFCNKIKRNLKEFNYIFSKKCYYEEECYYFEISEKYYIEFWNTNEVIKQEEILNNFINEVISFYI